MTNLKRTIQLSSLAALLLTFTAAEVFAKGRGRGVGQGRGPGLANSATLNLSAAQQTQIETLRAKYLPTQASDRAALMNKRVEKRSMLLADKIDRKAVLAKEAEMEMLRQKLHKARVEHRLAVMEVLEPGQRAAWMNRPGWAGRGGQNCPGNRAGWGKGRGQGGGRGGGGGRGAGGGWGGGGGW